MRESRRKTARSSSDSADQIPQTIAGQAVPSGVIRARKLCLGGALAERQPHQAPTQEREPFTPTANVRLAGNGSRTFPGKGNCAAVPKLLYTRQEAGYLLSLSLASIQELIHSGMLRVVRKGRLILVHREELERFAKEDTPAMWLPKENGRSVRTHAA